MHEVTIVEELDALPVGSVVREQRDGYLWGKRDGGGWSVGNSGSPLAAVRIVEEYAPLTVLFRPDAPQPDATGNSAFPVADDTIERALDDLCRLDDEFGLEPKDVRWVRESAQTIRDGFLAARGDATPTVTDRQERDACRVADDAHGLAMGAGEPWRHTYLAALGIEVEGGEQRG